MTLHVTRHQGANGSRLISASRVGLGTFCQDARPLAVGRTLAAGLLVQKVAVSAQEPVHVWRAARVLYDPRLCWLLMGLSPSLSARLFEWISSFTKADSGDDHVPLYPKGSQAPSSQ